MEPPRLKISTVMALVAVVGLNLAIFMALRDRAEGGHLFRTVPTVNILVLGGVAGFRRSRPFAIGFVVAGTMSLLAFQMWVQGNPWSFIRLATPPVEALDHRLQGLFPNAHEPIVYAVLVVFFAIPHSILGLAGGFLTAKGKTMVERRRRA
jgi:hypothetical protein